MSTTIVFFLLTALSRNLKAHFKFAQLKALRQCVDATKLRKPRCASYTPVRSIVLAFHNWHHCPEGNKNRDKETLRLRVIELAKKGLACVSGVKWEKKGTGRKEERRERKIPIG